MDPKRLEFLDVSPVIPEEERYAWDRYLAARLSSGSLTRSALEDADRMLEERRKRFGKAGT